MSEHLARIMMHKTTVSGSFDDEIVITGYVDKFESEEPEKRDVLRPVEPDEPDTEVEVGYSQNALEPLTLVFRERKIELTKSSFILFRYVYDIYRAEGRTEFDFAELSEALSGDDCGKSKTAIGKLIRQVATALAKIVSPISLRYEREILYVIAKVGNKK